MGGGGGGSLDSTNAISPTEASADLSGALGQSQGPDGVWAAPQTQGYGPAGQTIAPTSQYIQGAGVQTGIPQGGMMDVPGYGQTYIPGGYAAPGIASYFAGPQGGGGPGGNLSYDAGQHDAWLGAVDTGQQAGTTAFQAQAEQIAAANAANDAVDISGGGGTIDTLGGGTITADNAFEQGLGENVAGIIEAGGINPETGDANIVAGPNVLSAADEGLFGYGSDYNQEFQENYNAQSDHSDNNPTGQTTGTPLYDQGYVGLGVDPLADAVGGAINNSTIGTIGTAITGNPLMADVSSLLPPEESFSNYNDNDDGPSSVNNDGNPANDTGNAGWGFTSIADMFDGGGPGQSGDSFTGGIHGSNTVGDATDGFQVSDLTGGGGGGSDNDSGGGGGGGGGGCVIGTYALQNGLDLNRKGAVQWCEATLHDHWLGETVRMGYQHWGNNKIANGDAEARFNEFQNFADYVSGKNTSIIAGARVYARMAQCFTIGLGRRVSAWIHG